MNYTYQILEKFSKTEILRETDNSIYLVDLSFLKLYVKLRENFVFFLSFRKLQKPTWSNLVYINDSVIKNKRFYCKVY